jgi:hypothetical protein
MNRSIISVKNQESETIVKEAKKKAIDLRMSFSEIVLILLGKWLSGEITIKKGKK